MGHIQIKRVNEHQWGVFASRPYTKGSTVISSSLLQQPPTKHNDNDTITKIDNPSPESCSHSIQIDWDKLSVNRCTPWYESFGILERFGLQRYQIF